MTAKISKLSDLFSVYKKRIRPPQKTVETAFKKAVKDIVGVDINCQSIEYVVANKTIILHTSGIIKTEIKRHQIDVLQKLSSDLPVDSVPVVII